MLEQGRLAATPADEKEKEVEAIRHHLLSITSQGQNIFTKKVFTISFSEAVVL